MSDISYESAFKSCVEYFKGDELAATVFLTKYALVDEGKLEEATPDDMHRRLAKEFARVEAKYPNPMSEDEIFSLFKDFKYVVPQGSPMSGIGNPHQIQSISNCFVVESPHDSYGGILKTDQELVQIAKRRGGIGFDISTIRPKGMPTGNCARTTDGIEVFMDRFSNSCREVAQVGFVADCRLSHSAVGLDFVDDLLIVVEIGDTATCNIRSACGPVVRDATTTSRISPLDACEGTGDQTTVRSCIQNRKNHTGVRRILNSLTFQDARSVAGGNTISQCLCTLQPCWKICRPQAKRCRSCTHGMLLK